MTVRPAYAILMAALLDGKVIVANKACTLSLLNLRIVFVRLTFISHYMFINSPMGQARRDIPTTLLLTSKKYWFPSPLTSSVICSRSMYNLGCKKLNKEFRHSIFSRKHLSHLSLLYKIQNV